MAAVINNNMLEAILAEVRPLIGRGRVADYIPALACVKGDKLGIAISTIDGQHFSAGDADERFSIQSISKVLEAIPVGNRILVLTGVLVIARALDYMTLSIKTYCPEF